MVYEYYGDMLKITKDFTPNRPGNHQFLELNSWEDSVSSVISSYQLLQRQLDPRKLFTNIMSYMQ